MRVSVLSGHLPEPEGSASGRTLHAFCEGVVALGHELDVTSWRPAPPTGELAPWLRWQPVPAEHHLRTHARAVVRPRSDVRRLEWAPAPGAVALADEPISFAATAPFARNAVLFHCLTRLEVAAVGRRPTARDLQDMRADRRAARRAGRVLALSSRVADACRGTAVPIATAVPAEPLPIVERPVAGLLAFWEWPPNRAALDVMLRTWPSVRERVPGAELLIAGRGAHELGVGTGDGVRVLGEVGRSVDVLAELAVLAFPCPDSSGPKVKVLEAVAHGLPVVTTAAGVEGLALDGGGAVVATADRWVDALVDVLRAPARRAELAEAGRAAVATHHGPVPAARARLAALGVR
jgi:glycosyltransferase involved in cell wall biosynthesis